MTDQTIEAAYLEGVNASRATGADSLTVFNPYDDEAQADLYDAWERGNAEASQPGFVFDLDAMQRAAQMDWREARTGLSRTDDR